MFTFLNVPVAGAFHLIVPIIAVLHPLFGGVCVAVAVVLFTCAVRLLLLPLARAAVRGERARAVLAPRIATLRARHKNDPQRLQREVATLQQESGLSMFAGCLPMLAQAPFFTIMYRLFTSPTVAGHPNTLLAGSMFGVPLNQHLLATMHGPAGFVFLVLLAALGVVATLSMRWQAATVTVDPPPGARLMRYLAYFPLLVAAILPLVGGIYLLTSTTWTVVERKLLHRPG
ncbi:MAG TPA: membrane protein insertase YidC [Pseudonocardiaceae bacterium]